MVSTQRQINKCDEACKSRSGFAVVGFLFSRGEIVWMIDGAEGNDVLGSADSTCFKSSNLKFRGQNQQLFWSLPPIQASNYCMLRPLCVEPPLSMPVLTSSLSGHASNMPPRCLHVNPSVHASSRQLHGCHNSDEPMRTLTTSARNI